MCERRRIKDNSYENYLGLLDLSGVPLFHCHMPLRLQAPTHRLFSFPGNYTLLLVVGTFGIDDSLIILMPVDCKRVSVQLDSSKSYQDTWIC